MQVVHSVKLDNEEKNAILELAEKVADIRKSPAYAEAERPAALDKATWDFCNAMKEITHLAFTYGYNEGRNNADVKDTEMYKPQMP
jgi:hypothetical protein